MKEFQETTNSDHLNEDIRNAYMNVVRKVKDLDIMTNIAIDCETV